MSQEMKDVLVQLMNQQLTTQAIIMALTAAAIAGLGLYFASYLKQKASSLATREDFVETLEQLKLQTKEVEEIRTSLLVDANQKYEQLKHSNAQQLELFRNEISRTRDIIGIQRTAIISSMNALATAGIDAITIGWSAQYPALRDDPAGRRAAEQKLRQALTTVDVHRSLLLGMQAIEKASADKITVEVFMMRFTYVMGEMNKRDPIFMEEFPDVKPFSETVLNDHRKELDKEIADFRRAIINLLPTVRLPL